MKRIKDLIGYRNGEESGFTLIEMLIVVGIIVALAAAIVPQIVQFGDKGTTGAKDAEKSGVQAAMDTMITDKDLTGVDSRGTPTAGFAIWPEVGGVDEPLSAYLRSATTTYCYTWDNTGKLLTQADKINTPPVCPP